MLEKIKIKSPSALAITPEMTMQLQTVAVNSRQRAFAQRDPNEIVGGFDPTPAKQVKARYKYQRYIRHGSLPVAFAEVGKIEVPVGYAMVMPAPETRFAEIFRQLRGQPVQPELREINVLEDFQDEESLLAEDLVTAALRRYSELKRPRSFVAEEDQLAQRVLREFSFERLPNEKPFPRNIFSPGAEPANFYHYQAKTLTSLT